MKDTLNIESTGGKNSGTAKIHIFYIVVIILLLIGTGYFYSLYNKSVDEISTIKESIEQINTEKDKLLTQLDSLEQEILMHMGENEKLDSLLMIKQQEIEQMRTVIKTQGADMAEINNYKKQIDILGKTADQYIQENAYLKYQVDSLRTVSSVKQTIIDTMEVVDFQKTQKIEELNQKVEIGSVIRIGDLSMIGFNRRNKVMTRAKRVETFRVAGVMQKNVLATPGKKTLFIRITGPNGIVIASNSNNQFEYDGKTIMFSEKKEMLYNNNDSNFEIFVPVTEGSLEIGTYRVVIFCEGKEVGKKDIELK